MRLCRVGMESFSTKFSGLRETVPDTVDYILLDKIGMVWEYTREYTSIHSKSGTNTKYTEYTGIWGIC